MKPVLQALVLADRVYEDKATGKKIIAGTFSQLLFRVEPVPQPTEEPHEPEVAEEPGVSRGSGGSREPGAPKDPGAPIALNIPPGGMQAGSPHAYISVTDIHKEAKLTLRYVDLSEHNVLFQTEIMVRCDDVLRTVEVVVPLPPLPQIAGNFALEVLAEDELLGSHRVVVKHLPA